jgi:hypothetical protein
MPTLANLVLADGQASPANVTFAPNANSNNVWNYDDGGDPASAQRTLTLSLTLAKKKTDFTVATAVFRVPYVDSTTGTLLWYDQGKAEYRFGYGSLLAKRKDLFAFVKNLHANADFGSLVKDRQGML